MAHYAAVTVAGTAIGLLDTITEAAIRKFGANVKATVVVETAQVRYRADGTDPTASVGTPADPDDVIELESADEIVKFRAIRTGGTSAALHVHVGPGDRR